MKERLGGSELSQGTRVQCSLRRLRASLYRFREFPIWRDQLWWMLSRGWHTPGLPSPYCKARVTCAVCGGSLHSHDRSILKTISTLLPLGFVSPPAGAASTSLRAGEAPRLYEAEAGLGGGGWVEGVSQPNNLFSFQAKYSLEPTKTSLSQLGFLQFINYPQGFIHPNWCELEMINPRTFLS